MSRGFSARTAAACLVLAAVLLAGCAQEGPRPTVTSQAKRPCPVEKLAVAPFQTPWACDVPMEVACPITGDLFPQSPLPDTARMELTAALPRAVEKVFLCPLVPAQTLAGAMPVRPGQSGEAVRQALAQAARKVGAQTVIVGTVFSYQERVGGQAGINKPASVYFNLYSIEAKSGNIIWQGTFRETQTSLSENLFRMGDFFERGGRWLTAAELSEAGMIKLLSRMRVSAVE